MKVGLIALDYLLHFIHVAIMVVCIFGWMYEPLRPLHLIVMALVALSWFGLGLVFGIRYCILTDTQWRIKRHLGREPETRSYVKHMLEKITGRTIDHKITNRITLYTYGASVISTVVVNLAP